MKKIIENTLIPSIAIITTFSGNIILIIIGLPFLVITSAKIVNSISKNKIKDSIYGVSKTGRIYQNALADPIKLIKILKTKDKMQVYKQEAKKMFEQLKRTDKNNNVIRYNTISHIMTYKLLKDLEKEGYIEKLEKIPHKKKKLFFEKIAIGNNQKINKKYQMYKISFELTEKKLTKINDEIKQPEIISDNKKEKTNIEKINELKNLKEELLNNQNDNVKTR